MSEWLPMFALPNIETRQPIEVDGFALVSIHDERLQRMVKKHRRFGSYLKRFKNEFGEQIVPSILICRDDAPERYRGVDAIAGFRDAIAMSVIPQSWGRVLRLESNFGIKYSDYFAVYPWMIDKNYNYLITNTLDMLGLHQVSMLRAQSGPALSRSILGESPLDWPLLDELVSRWKSCFGGVSSDTEDLKLFRSLNMANAAARLPAGADVTNLDIGRSVSLWSSAFEILVPAKSEAFRNVYALLDKIAWSFTPCQERKYEAFGFKKDKTKRNLPSWLFGEINAARNDFLHGNPISKSRLIVSPARRPLHLYVSLLYRMALAAFLNLKYVPRPRKEGETEYEARWRDDFAFGRFQGDIEVALSTIMTTEEEYREQRSGESAAVRVKRRE